MPSRTYSIPKLKGLLRENVPLASYTTLRMGGPADFFWEPDDIDSLAMGIQQLYVAHIPWMVVGGGSNLIVSSYGFQGGVIHLGKGFQTITTDGVYLTSRAGATFSRLLQACVENSLSGIEFLVGVPATLGGAVAMNFGAHGKSIGETVENARVVRENGDVSLLSPLDLQLSYRKSILLEKPWILVEATLKLAPALPSDIKKTIQQYQDQRRQTQPLASSSCGCLFKNPPGKSAGALIDQAGCKGWRKGGAAISLIHANFLVNEGDATPEDAVELLRNVQNRVHEHSGVLLEPEARLIGFPR